MSRGILVENGSLNFPNVSGSILVENGSYFPGKVDCAPWHCFIAYWTVG